MQTLYYNFNNCQLCPHKCGVNRTKKQLGKCQAGSEILISHIGLHFGEEPPISGTRGSGTIFFSHCNLACVFCQNHQISQSPSPENSKVYSKEDVAEEMLKLQEKGAHNINLVSPTHVMTSVAECINIARKKGLSIPIVYNSNGYDSVETLKIFTGLIDIYMPDIKYASDQAAEKYSNAPQYFEVCQAALKEMHEQVGLLECDNQGVAQKGMLIRHLVLPNNQAESLKCLDFLASLSKELTISIMSQYSPQHRAVHFDQINRRLSKKEYQTVVDHASALELDNCFIQELSSSDCYLPDFNKETPFI